jgi:hypothetical protein
MQATTESAPARFRPGFRLSALDVVVLIAGTAAAGGVGMYVWWIGYVIAFVVLHFFLFCNVLRMARPLELIWAAVLLVLAGGTVATGYPGWVMTTAASLVATIVVSIVEMRKPSYHGAAWQWINPGLRQWWESRTT